MYFKFLMAAVGLNLPLVFALEMFFNSFVQPDMFIGHLLWNVLGDSQTVVSPLTVVTEFVGSLDPGEGNTVFCCV